MDEPQKIDSLPLENQVSIRNYEININAWKDLTYLQNELITLIEQKYIKMAMANSYLKGDYLKGDFDSLISGSNKINTPQIKTPSVSELPLQEQLSIQVVVNAIKKCSDIQILKEYCLDLNRELHVRSILVNNLIGNGFKSFPFTNKQNIQLDTDNSDD